MAALPEGNKNCDSFQGVFRGFRRKWFNYLEAVCLDSSLVPLTPPFIRIKKEKKSTVQNSKGSERKMKDKTRALEL